MHQRLDAVHVHQHNVGALPCFQSANPILEKSYFRAVHGGQVEYLMGRGVPGRASRLTMDLLSQPHLLKDVVVVVDPRLIDSDGDSDVLVHQPVQGATPLLRRRLELGL